MYNTQRSEKDPSAWAMVHEVGHGLHFSEAAADMAFVTKTALALRDAHSKESQTAPFKSIQALQSEKPTDDARASKHLNGAPAARANGNNIFSYNSTRAAKTPEATDPPYEDDSNVEKDSTASFDFNRNRPPVVGPLTKPTPSKWDDAEKWLSAGEAAPAKPRPKNSPLSGSARKGDAAPDDTNPSDGENDNFDGDDHSPEKHTKLTPSSKKSLLPRFAFMPGTGKPLPLPLPVAPVDRYPLDDVVNSNPTDDDNNNHNNNNPEASLDAAFSKAASRTAKPTAGVTLGKKSLTSITNVHLHHIHLPMRSGAGISWDTL